MAPTATQRAHFIIANTQPTGLALLPEMRLYQASDVTPLWQATAAVLERADLPPPFWAFAWAGGLGLARHVLDNPALVRGRRVLDFAAGSGLVGIAAALAGAAQVLACDIDPYALSAIALNAALNGVEVATTGDDLLDAPQRKGDHDVVLIGDVCYERPMAARVFAWARAQAAHGALVLMGDPGRTYLPDADQPDAGLERVASLTVPTSRALEDADTRLATIWRVLPPAVQGL